MLKLCHGLEDRLLDGSDEEISDIADLVSVQCFFGILHYLIQFYKLQKGAHGSRADDTKGMKGPILDWISANDPLVPSLHRRNKSDRGFNHNKTGVLLCPAGLDWNIPEQVSYDVVLVNTYKSIFRIRHKLRSGELHVRGDQWPSFLYTSYDPENPWSGLLRNPLLVMVGLPVIIKNFN